jgi:hypothetical protein
MVPLRIGLIITAGMMAGILGMGRPAAWGANSCVDCHRRAETIKVLPAWYQDQFIHWYGSVHGRKGVTCEKCHAGDPARTDKKLAHQGVKPSRDSKSPIYYKNLPETCGSCHKGVYQQFVRSRHYENLRADRLAPTCTTCHGFEMDIGGVALSQLAGRCTICHNPLQGVKPEVAELTREIVEAIIQTEHAIQRALVAIELAREQGRESKDAEELVGTARDRLRKTGELWHRFGLDDFGRELIEIQRLSGQAYTAARDAMLTK